MQTGGFILNVEDAEVLSTSDIETESFNLSIYPNPTDGDVTIKLANNEIIKNIEIYSLTGKKVLETKNEETLINVHQLSKGIYLVKVLGDRNTYVKKLIIK